MTDNFNPADPVDAARVEAVVSISNAILQAISKELTIHGKDPRNNDIVASAVALSIHRLTQFSPDISFYIATIMASTAGMDFSQFDKAARKGSDPLN